jgi:hypothetical protein
MTDSMPFLDRVILILAQCSIHKNDGFMGTNFPTKHFGHMLLVARHCDRAFNFEII